jgi:hypothetical protein
LKAAGKDQEDDEADGGDCERDVRDEAKVWSDDAANGRDEEKNEDEDVEEFFEDDGAENGGGGCVEVIRVSEDAHDVADAEGENIVGGERGHEDAGADLEVALDGASAARHHLAPTETAQAVTGEGEADDAKDPCGMDETESKDLVEGDSAEGVPKEEGADEQAWNGLIEIAAFGWSGGYGVHRDTAPRALWREREGDTLR